MNRGGGEASDAEPFKPLIAADAERDKTGLNLSSAGIISRLVLLSINSVTPIALVIPNLQLLGLRGGYRVKVELFIKALRGSRQNFNEYFSLDI